MMDKKEIKREYRQRAPDMGIFQIRNLENGKVCIGRAMDLNGKLNSEKFQLKNNMHMNRELQKDFNEMGETRFSFEVLDRLAPGNGPDQDYGLELQTLEAMWLEKLQPFAAHGYHKKKA
jgi:hypothetical protein